MTVLEFLASRGGFYSLKEIAKATGLTQTEARKRLNGLAASGEVVKRNYRPDRIRSESDAHRELRESMRHGVQQFRAVTR